MFLRFIHADVCIVQSFVICIGFNCVNIPQLIYPFFCPRAFGFYLFFAVLKMLLRTSWMFMFPGAQYTTVVYKYTTFSGVYTLEWNYWVKFFSEWLEQFTFHSLELLLHYILTKSRCCSPTFQHHP